MSLSVSSYISRFYKGNIFGATKNGRTGQTSNNLALADMKAIRKAVRELGDYDYDDGDGEELVNKVQAFVSTYNNYIDSAKGVGNNDMNRYLSQLKKLTKEHADELEDIGITIQNSGKLTVDKKTLQETGRYQVSKLFAADAEYSVQTEKQMKRTYRMFMRNSLNIPKQSMEPVSKPSESGPSENEPSEGDSTSAGGSVPEENIQLAQQLAKILSGSQVDYTV